LSEATDAYLYMAIRRVFCVAKPPRWKPLVLQKIIVPAGPWTLTAAWEGTRRANSSAGG
jgi:hypothetical protein